MSRDLSRITFHVTPIMPTLILFTIESFVSKDITMFVYTGVRHRELRDKEVLPY